MDFINLDKISPEQKFAFMLLERIEKLEHDHENLQNEFITFKKKLNGTKKCKESDELFDLILKHKTERNNSSFNKKKEDLISLIPKDLQDKISDKELEDLESFLVLKNASFEKIIETLYWYYVLTGGFNHPDVVKWIQEKLYQHPEFS